MTARTVIAAVSGLGAGVAFAVTNDSIPTGDLNEVLLSTAVRALPLVCTTVIVTGFLRRYITRHEMSQRGSKAREELPSQAVDESKEHLAKRLDETVGALNTSRQQCAQLQHDFDELAADHNRLIRETLQERVERFSQRPQHSTAGRRRRRAAGPALQAITGASGTPARLSEPGTDPPQQGRAASGGVGDPA